MEPTQTESFKNELNIQKTPTGATTAKFIRADGRDFFLHSQYDPVDEAQFLLADLPLKAKTLYVMLGFGIGHHIRALLDKIPDDSYLIVVEPNSEKFSEMIRDICRKNWDLWMEDYRLVLLGLNTAASLNKHLAQYYLKYNLQTTEFFTHLPSTRTNEVFYAQAWDNFSLFPDYLTNHQTKITQYLVQQLANYWHNLSLAWQTPPVELLTGKFANQPAIIITAHTFTPAMLSTLQQVQEQVIIICTSEVFPLLQEKAIKADFVITTAAIKPVINNEQEQTTLIYCQNTGMTNISDFIGAKFLYADTGEHILPLVEPAAKSFLCTEGPTIAALEFAWLIEANPVILVDIDVTLSPAEEIPADPACQQQLVHDYLQSHTGVCYLRLNANGAERLDTKQCASFVDFTAFLPSIEGKVAATVTATAFNAYKAPKRKDILAILRSWEQEIKEFLTYPDCELQELLRQFERLEIHTLNRTYYQELFSFYRQVPAEQHSSFITQLLAHCDLILMTIKEIRKA